jgi:hypothetical protein
MAVPQGPTTTTPSQADPQLNFAGRCFDFTSLELDITSYSSDGTFTANWIARAGYFNNPTDIVGQVSGKITWEGGTGKYAIKFWGPSQSEDAPLFEGHIALGASGKWDGGDLFIDGGTLVGGGPGTGSRGAPGLAYIHGCECDGMGSGGSDLSNEGGYGDSPPPWIGARPGPKKLTVRAGPHAV